MNEKIINLLNSKWDLLNEKTLTDRKFKHKDIIPLINKLNNYSSKFIITEMGESVEKRKIYSISIGTGNIKIALWSQMHGDESTATAAFFDLFNFFISENLDKEIIDFRNNILSRINLSFIPMLNPDGAERFIRENGINIDLNRDAIEMISPESKILMNFIDNLKPAFAFNMHDQDYLWSVGNSNRIAAISFLAPPYDYEKSIDSTRLKAMSLISELHKTFNPIVDYRITRYSDEYEPRAFGDTIAGKKISTILFESGLWKEDTNKFFLRKMNLIILLKAFYLIANNFIEDNTLTYKNIPINGKILDKMD